MVYLIINLVKHGSLKCKNVRRTIVVTHSHDDNYINLLYIICETLRLFFVATCHQ